MSLQRAALLSVPLLALLGCGDPDEDSPRNCSVAVRGPFTITASAEGQIKALNEFSVASPARGRIEWLHPNGELAKKGDIIVRLEARDQLKRARDLKRDLDTLKREVKELEANLEIERRRSALQVERKEAEVQVAKVKLRELEDAPTPEALAEAKADFKSSKALAESAESDHRETRTLLKKGFATEAEADSKRIGSLIAGARMELSEIKLKKVADGADSYELGRSRTALKRARINLALVKQESAATLTGLQQSLDWAKERLRRASRRLEDNRKDIESRRIKAPRDGVVVHVQGHRGRQMEEGSRVWRGVGIVNLPDLNAMKVRSYVSENDVRHLEMGDIVEVTVDPIPGETFKAKVIWIDNWARDKNAELSDADQKKQGLSGLRVFDFEAEILKSDARLKLGFQAHVTVPLYRIDDAITIDARVVQRDHGAPYVYVLDDSKVRRQPVELGAWVENTVVVTKGLSAGQRVLLR